MRILKLAIGWLAWRRYIKICIKTVIIENKEYNNINFSTLKYIKKKHPSNDTIHHHYY